MSYSDIEHFSNMVSGCEALTSGDFHSPNGIYAFTVLKLHANDAGLYAGQEGFLDMVKKGAKSVKDWFLKLIKAIINFIDDVRGNGVKRKRMEKELAERDRKIQKDLDAMKAREEKYTKAAAECFRAPAEETKRIYDEIENGDYFDNPLFEKLNVTTLRVGGGHTAMEELSQLSKEPNQDTHLYVAKHLEVLDRAVAELARESARTVNKYSDDEAENRKVESGIRTAGVMLTKFTRVVKLWDDALNRFYKMVS